VTAKFVNHWRLIIPNSMHWMDLSVSWTVADSRSCCVQQQARRLSLWVRLYRLPESTPTIAIYYYYSAQKLILILTSHGGWVDLVGWLHTEMVYLSTDGHPSSTNRVWRSTTMLIEANVLPLSQTANQFVCYLQAAMTIKTATADHLSHHIPVFLIT